MIGLLDALVRLALLAIFAFVFVVLFDYGPAGFVQGAPTELKSFVSFAESKVYSLRGSK